MSLHIVHIGPCHLPLRHSRGGAIERRMVELGAAQAARGYQVTLYSAESDASVSHFRGMELRAIACRRSGIGKRIEFLRQAVRDVRGADVLHFHSVPEGAMLAASKPETKLLSYDYFRWRGARLAHGMYRHALSKFDLLLPVSEYCRSESLRYWSLPAVKARVLYNGVNLEQFQPDAQAGTEMRNRLGLASGPVILYVGRVCYQKGTDLLVDAYRRIKREIDQVHLVVAGPAERFANRERNWLTGQIRRCGGTYLGAVEESDLAALYNACDVFVMPTRRDEMFGMAALEAQACGKPVVCSRHGGLVEVVSEASGRYFRVGDSGDLAAQLLWLLHSSEELRSLSEAARRNAERFGWARIANETENVYELAADHAVPVAR